ncbi:methyltransferase domain-containing protein [Candidatus Omnitrophota bacterium]
MKTDYRAYYEQLARARESLRNKRQLELDQNNEPEPIGSAYRMDCFKNVLYKMICQRVNPDNPPTILDAGCGYGFDLVRLSKLCRFNGCGTDLSLTQLKLSAAEDTLKGCKFTQADAQNLPFKDGSLDMVVLSEVIEHLPQPKMCLEGIHRILKNQGWFFLSTPNRWGYFHMLGQIIPKKFRSWLALRLRGKVDVDSSDYITQPGMVEHLHLFAPVEIQSVLKKAGFKIEEVRGSYLAVPWPQLFNRLKVFQFTWEALNKLVSKFSWSIYLQEHILIVAKKEGD